MMKTDSWVSSCAISSFGGNPFLFLIGFLVPQMLLCILNETDNANWECQDDADRLDITH